MGKNRWGLNRTQRMQLKAFACLMGILLIAILLFAKLIVMLVHIGEEPEPHIPVVETLLNVWIMEEEEGGLLLFRDGEEESYSYGPIAVTEEGVELLYRPKTEVRENVADVVLTDGRITNIKLKQNKINGKILSVDEAGIEVEGYGRLPLSADYRGYRLYDSLKMCTARELFFGYSHADLCVENGVVCGILLVQEAAMENIRVLVKASDYSGLLHEAPVITSDVDFTVIYGNYDNQKQEKYSAGTVLTFGADSPYFEAERVKIIPSVLTGKVLIKNCFRSQGTPAYRGRMELLKTEGGIAVINEVLLEEYLFSVVPSEMPSNYPSEALKAQAICARTYAYGHIIRAGYPQYGAHVDDSTSYQVYNNIREQESTTTAVKETYGQLLLTGDNNLAGTYYYSTSCGVGSDSNVWKTAEAPTLTYLQPKALNKTVMAQALSLAESGGQTEDVNAGEEAGAAPDGETVEPNIGELLKSEEAFAAFITSANEADFEATEGWYRWSYQVEELDKKRMLEMLQKRYKANEQLVLTWDEEKKEYVSKAIKKLYDITDIYVEKRGSGGYVDELIIETEKQKIKVISEHNIRYVLNDGATKVVRQDGSKVEMPSLLPSGFFIVETIEEDEEVLGYTITGGGFGHGVGMSQNGARAMAKSGYTAEDILLYFYDGCSIENVYEGANE